MDNSVNFEVILERCLEDIRSRICTQSECLLEYPEYSSELEPLLKISDRLYAAGNVKASAQFRERALMRFKETNAPRQKPRVSPYPISERPVNDSSLQPSHDLPRPQPRNKFTPALKQVGPSFIFILAILLVVVLASSSVALAANSAYPGGMFYPVKQLIEKVELGLANSDLTEQQLHLKFASRRLAELDYLLQRNRTLYIDLPLADYLQHLSYLSSLLYSSDLSDEERVMIASQLLASPAMDEILLQTLYQRISPEQRAQIKEAIASALTTRNRAQQVINGLPEVRDRIREILLSTVDADTEWSVVSTQSVLSTPVFSRTPQPAATEYTTFVPEWTQNVPANFRDWLTNTPDLALLATRYPSLYPTLSNLATLYPTYYSTLSSLATQRSTLKAATQYPPVKPTEVRPTRSAPTRTTPAVIPTRPAVTANP